MQEHSWLDTLKAKLKLNLRQFTMIGALLVIWLVFGLLTDGVFISNRNISNLFVQTTTTAILAMGMVLIIVSGNIDLAVGSAMGFCGSVAVMSMIKFNWGIEMVIGVTLITGMLIGAWHGFWVAYRRVPAFIVTLASMLALRGAIIGLSDGQTLGVEMASSPVVAERFQALGQGYLPTFNPATDGQWHDSSVLFGLITLALVIGVKWYQRHRRQQAGLSVLPLSGELMLSLTMILSLGGFFAVLSSYLGMPYCIILALALATILSIVMSHTVFGRHLYAIGGNAEAARFSGINIKQRTMLSFVTMGLMVGLAALVSTARLNAATTSAGQNAELDAIAAAVIGGTSLVGGEGTIWGAIVGALIMTSLDNGMSLMNMDITYQYLIKGAILLLAVWADMATRKQAH